MGTLDSQKLIKMNINHMNNSYMKISQITVYAYTWIGNVHSSYIEMHK